RARSPEDVRRRVTGEDAMQLTLTHAPVANTGMLIRKDVAKVFDAFIDPAITTKFWFTKSSGRLEPDKRVQWEWEMYGASAQVEVKAITPNERIVIEWTGYGAPTTVEWTFTARPDGTTFVSVTESGFGGDGDQVVQSAIGSAGGFTWMLAGLKALLEHDV